MTLVMCSIENGSHRSLLIFLSVIHSLVTLLRRSHTDSGQSRRGRRALLKVNGMVVCANVCADMRSDETARVMRWGWVSGLLLGGGGWLCYGNLNSRLDGWIAAV